MRGMDSATVDLIYLDPPFNSNANYAAPIGSEAAGAEFKDTWALSDIDIEWLDVIEEPYPILWRVLMAAMRDSDKSYLIYMAIRLLEMKRLLKPTGSMYLHCDPTMSHYLKLVMDAIWGREHFRNEIVWSYGKWTNVTNQFQRNHDCILFYSASQSKGRTFNKQFSDKQSNHYEKGYHTNVITGGISQLIVYDRDKALEKINSGKYDKIVYREGETQTALSDVWDIPILNPMSKERTGFKTQKPLALLKRIILASSNEGDMVLDPFCGCATTCVSAHHYGRYWIGIDISAKAAELVVARISKAQGSLYEKVIHRTSIPQRTDLGQLRRYNCRENKTQLYGTQEGNCAHCKTHFEIRHLEVDHITAQSKGGTDHISNLQLLCSSCNRIKGNRGMEYLRQRLRLAA